MTRLYPYPRALVRYDHAWDRWRVYRRPHAGVWALEDYPMNRLGSFTDRVEALDFANHVIKDQHAEMTKHGFAIKYEENYR